VLWATTAIRAQDHCSICVVNLYETIKIGEKMIDKLPLEVTDTDVLYIAEKLNKSNKTDIQLSEFLFELVMLVAKEFDFKEREILIENMILGLLENYTVQLINPSFSFIFNDEKEERSIVFKSQITRADGLSYSTTEIIRFSTENFFKFMESYIREVFPDRKSFLEYLNTMHEEPNAKQ